MGVWLEGGGEREDERDRETGGRVGTPYGAAHAASSLPYGAAHAGCPSGRRRASQTAMVQAYLAALDVMPGGGVTWVSWVTWAPRKED